MIGNGGKGFVRALVMGPSSSKLLERSVEDVAERELSLYLRDCALHEAIWL